MEALVRLVRQIARPPNVFIPVFCNSSPGAYTGLYGQIRILFFAYRQKKDPAAAGPGREGKDLYRYLLEGLQSGFFQLFPNSPNSVVDGFFMDP